MSAHGEDNKNDKTLTQTADTEDAKIVIGEEPLIDEDEPTQPAADDYEEAESEKPKLGIGGIVKALSKAVASGDLKSSQARRMKQDLGIMNSFFTRSQPKQATRKNKRKAAKKARKVNRRNKKR